MRIAIGHLGPLRKERESTIRYIYIAGKYTGRTHDAESYFEIQRNIDAACEAARELARRGYGFFCPHQHSAHFEVIAPDIPPAYWYELDLHFMYHCDALLMLPGWEQSRGAVIERDEAYARNTPVFYSIGELVEHMPAEG